MMKKFLTTFLFSILLLGCSEENKDNASAEKIYSVATCADYPPFEYLENSKVVGFDIDLINALAEKLNIKIQINDMPFEGILGSLQSNRTDLAISALTPTPERQKAADFSDEYFSTDPILVCSDLSPVKNITDLTGLAIGVQASSIYESYANQELKETTRVTIKSLPRIPELVQDLKSRRISCILLGQQESEPLLRSNKGLRLVKIETNKTAAFAIAMPKGSPLKEKLNKGLAELKADGTLKKLQEKWLQK